MKLEKTIRLKPSKWTDPNGKVIDPEVVVLDELSVIYLDNPTLKQYYVSIHPLQQPIMLFEKDQYHLHITKEMARDRILELSEGDIERYLQNFFPRTLEDDPYGPGSILAGMFSALGIKAGPNCSCKRHALEMNRKGIEWCEENIDTICGWLREESEKRKLPFVEAVAKLVVGRALTKAKKYRKELENAT